MLRGMILPIVLVAAACDVKGGSYDAGEEEEEFVCTPTQPQSVCNAQYNCGCESGSWCRWMFSRTECHFYEGCSASLEGTATEGQQCDPSDQYPDPPLCLPGLVCLQASPPEVGYCRELCSGDGDCGGGTTCLEPGLWVLPSGVCGGESQHPPFTVCL